MKTDRLTYWLYCGAVRVLGRMPLEIVVRIGRSVGIVGWNCAPSYRRLVLKNLELAFGDTLEAGEKRALGREHFARLVSNLMAGVKLAQMEPKAVLERVTVEGLEHVHRLVKEKRGMVMILSHLGNWELLAQVSPGLFGCPCGTVYQSLSNPYIDQAVKAQRAREGLLLFARREGFFGAIELLRAGGSVGVLADQHAGDGGVWSSLFGRLASSSPLPATLAMRTGAVLLPAAMYTEPGARWRFVIQPPVEPASRDTNLVTVQVNQILESQIRVSPADWLWAHNRWKTPKPKFLLGGSKRGVVPGAITCRFRLVIRATNWLGDAVMTVPAIRAIRRTRPDLELTVLTPGKLAGFWNAVPEVDCVLSLPAEGGIRATVELLRKGNYDAIVLFPNSLRVGLEGWFAGIPRRVGYRGHSRAWLLNQVLDPVQKSEGAPEHQVHHYLRLAESMGAAPMQDSEWTLPRHISKPATGRILQLAICPGAEYGPAKRWFPERFAAVMKAISARHPCQWHVVGVLKDAPIGDEIVKAFGPDGLENWIGRTSLDGLISLLRGCDLLLTNDTGTMHLAAMFGVPVVAIFGSTEPVLTGPLGAGHSIVQHRVACGPCFRRQCHLDFACMQLVTVEEVLKAVESKICQLAGQEKGSAARLSCSNVVSP